MSAGASLEHALLICGLCSSLAEDNQSRSLVKWEEIPTELRHWIQAQEGLRVDQRSITTSAELIKAHQLLSRKPPKITVDSCGILAVALDVAIRYFKQVELIGREEPAIKDLVIKGQAPRNIMRRKCGLCGRRVLDDAHARYKRIDPNRYILRFLQNGCGLPSCPGNNPNTWAVPVDPAVLYIRPDAKKLAAPPRKPGWEEYFLRPCSEAESLVPRVTIICRKCRTMEFEDRSPRWTRESQARYVLRRPSCAFCKQKNTNWVPKDDTIRWVDPSKLSRKWLRLLKQPGFQTSDVMENPDWYIP